MPIKGAITAAKVIVLPGNPIIGEIAIREKTAYNAAKHTVRAMFFGSSFLVAAMLLSLQCLFGWKTNYPDAYK
jgi:hypothetical protein